MNKESMLGQILKNTPSAWIGHKDFAIWLVKYLNPKITVDLGVDYGHSTFIFASPNIGEVYGVDSFAGDENAGLRNTYDYVNHIKNLYKFDNVTFIRGYFDQVATTWDKPINILHIDGLHTYDAVKYDYETWKKFVNDDTVILFHDTESFKDTVGKFFQELDLPKTNFIHSAGLGVACKNTEIINIIKKEFNL